jgi:hypothetical protein
MQVAQLMFSADRKAEAMDVAFRSYRNASGDSRIHRAFIALAISTREAPPAPDFVGPNTYVRLKNQEGLTREHVIFPDGPTNPLRNEMTLQDATAAGLVGLAVGQSFEQPGLIWPLVWTVDEVLPAIVYAVRDAMDHYSDRFPNEPPFFAGFSVSSEPTVSDWRPLLVSLERRRAFAVRVLEMYRKQGLPLGLISKMSGVPISAVIAQVRESPPGSPLLAEWPGLEQQKHALVALRESKELVLTRSALCTSTQLDTLSAIKARWTLVAPRSLRADLIQEVAQATQAVRDGHTSVGMEEGGIPSRSELPPGDPRLIEYQSQLQRTLDWTLKHVSLLPRPLEVLTRRFPFQRDAGQ